MVSPCLLYTSKTMVNNDIKQESNTKNMIFSPLELVKYISNIMTLNPGDIIAVSYTHLMHQQTT